MQMFWSYSKMSLEKTKLMFQPKPGEPHLPPVITIERHALEPVEKFIYLGSTLSRDVQLNLRLSKASSSLSRLHKSLWET